MEKLFEARDTTTDEDLYKLLGCDETSSDEQIATEFKQLARKYHPDKALEANRAAAKEMFVKLEKAREVLLDKEKRSKYDQWRSGGFKNIISFEKWLEMNNRVHTSMHWAMPQKPVLSLPEADITANTSNTNDGQGQHGVTQVTTDSNGQAPSHPVSLKDFRRDGGRGGCSQLSNFRNYNV